MRYLRVSWLHTHPDEPVVIYSELDDQGWETRKVEIFRDGSVGFASRQESGHGSTLSERPVPSLEEIAADPQFQPAWITQDEFEEAYARRPVDALTNGAQRNGAAAQGSPGAVQRE